MSSMGTSSCDTSLCIVEDYFSVEIPEVWKNDRKVSYIIIVFLIKNKIPCGHVLPVPHSKRFGQVAGNSLHSDFKILLLFLQSWKSLKEHLWAPLSYLQKHWEISTSGFITAFHTLLLHLQRINLFFFFL